MANRALDLNISPFVVRGYVEENCSIEKMVERYVALYRNDNAEPTIFRSKAVGEPPLLLAFSVLLAIRAAIASVAPDSRHAPTLRAPATPEAILDALEAQAARIHEPRAREAAQPAPVN